MFDIGWSELVLIGIVALIVVGPEDLPRMFRALGRMTAKAKAMAREFSSAMEDAAKESGINDAAKSLGEVRGLTSKKALGLDALDRAASKFETWEPKRPTAPAAVAPQPDPATAKPKTTAPAAPAPVPTVAVAAAPAPATVAAAPEDQPGRRTLKAVRRSDAKDA